MPQMMKYHNSGDNGLKTANAMATSMDSDWKMLKAETALLMITSVHESRHCFTQVSVAPNAEPSVLSSWTPSTLSLCSSALPHCTTHHSIVISDTEGPLQHCLHSQNSPSNGNPINCNHQSMHYKPLYCYNSFMNSQL